MNWGKRMSDDRALSELLSAVAADWDLTHFSRRRFMKLAGTVGGLAVGGSTLAWLIEACGGSSTAAANTNATLTMAVFQEPDTLDPSASGLITVGAISGCIFDHLIWDLPGHGSTRVRRLKPSALPTKQRRASRQQRPRRSPA